jgi:hypothetical protein
MKIFDTPRARAALLLALAAAWSAPAHAEFTGAWAPGNWSVANTGSIAGGVPGQAQFTNTTLTLTGGDAPGAAPPYCQGGVYADLASPCNLSVTIGVGAPYSFNWAYTSNDADGPPGDIFGYLVDGKVTALSDPGGAVSQGGRVTVQAQSSFGWFLNCTDCSGGAAVVRISDFAFVPEPGSLALVLAAGAVAGLGRRRGR